MQDQGHHPRVAEMRSELEYMTQEEIPDWIATVPQHELEYAMAAMTRRNSAWHEARRRMDATEREVIDSGSGVMTLGCDEAAVAEAQHQRRLLLVREQRNRRLSAERRRCAALPCARTAPRPRGAGRPRAAASRSSARSGDSPDEGSGSSDGGSDADAASSSRQRRAEIAAEVTRELGSTAAAARHLIRERGWSWDHAYSATGDIQLYGFVTVDGRGRVLRPTLDGGEAGR